LEGSEHTVPSAVVVAGHQGTDNLLWSGAAFHQPDKPGGVGQAELIDKELYLVRHKLFDESITRRN
jgi:hypothetical protein